jgi:UDP-glucose 4-epimerase
MKGKHVIVTGGLGFIGSHLVEKLVEDNDVAIIDNQSTGKLENVSHLNSDNLKIIEGDIRTLNLAAIFEDYEYVFHQAALPSVPRSVLDPYIERNILSQFATPEMTPYDALDTADALVLMTAHAAFEGLDLPKIKDIMRTPIIVDGRRFFKPDSARKLGFIYKGIGAQNG